jgi:hypothetical protein
MFKQAEGITYFSMHQFLESPESTWVNMDLSTDEALTIWGSSVNKISDELINIMGELTKIASNESSKKKVSLVSFLL